ncbi:hypothetical protein [Gilvimarinus polysaccharolyticus]|uniref:hypothetical protein n=1 Tax=Gilvimarinus polysaccharolyticus TaxID=863921 RepID=UPI0006736A5F|nr:hypothetical protein [Gilvimarinus polysaccharolyticus]
MKYLRYAFVAFLSGIFFSLGAFVVITYAIPLFLDYDSDSIYREEIDRVEEKLGKSCIDLHHEVIVFAKNDIGEIINQGLKGGDWIAIITKEQKIFLDEVDEHISECQRAEYSARKLGYNWPSFDDLQYLYSALKIYSTRYGEGPASSRDLKPEALDRLIFNYQNVTSKGI